MLGTTEQKARLTCKCGAVNRIALGAPARSRCGKCHYVFTPMDLVKAVPEVIEKPVDNQTGGDYTGPMLCCTDDDCGWEGEPNEADWDTGKPCCPDCGEKVKADV